MHLRYVAGLILLMTATYGFCACPPRTDDASRLIYPIDHQLRPSGDLTPISVQHGDIIRFRIVDTDPECYLYNARTEERPNLERDTGACTVVDLDVVHDDATVAYLIDVTPRNASDTSCTAGARSWRIPVRSLWNLSAAGGFARHSLTDRVYFLTQAQHTKPDNSVEQGFTVSENASARDDHQVIGVAMAHLYLSYRGWKGVTWAPLSFGLGVDSSRADYLVGTSARFSDRVYVTVGRLLGTRHRLPDGLQTTAPNNFTTNANALNSLPTQRAQGWFVSATFGFLQAGVSNLFKTKLGIPQVNNGASTPPTQPVNAAAEITPSPATGPPKTAVKLTAPDKVNFGGQSDDSFVNLDSKKLNSSKELAAEKHWSDKEVTIVIPEAQKPGPVIIKIVKDGVAVATAKFTVTEK